MGRKKQHCVAEGTSVLELHCGGVVFLYDEGNVEAIRRLRPGRDEPFDVSLCDPSYAQALGDEGLCVAIALEGRDPDFTAEVSIGKMFGAKERAVARWLRPQRAKLRVPTGRLRFETPFSIPLDRERPDPEEADEEDRFAARLDVPPGDYLLTVHRIDREQMRRDRLLKTYKGQEHLLSLTGLSETPNVAPDGAVLRCPDQEPDRSWIGNYCVIGDEFTCQVLFWDFLSWFRLNLDREAIRQLGLPDGGVMRLEAAGFTIDALFLDSEPAGETAGYAPQQRHDETLGRFRSRYGRDRLAREIAGRPEFAIGSWNRYMDREILGFHRERGAVAIPRESQELWMPAHGQVLPESFRV